MILHETTAGLRQRPAKMRDPVEEAEAPSRYLPMRSEFADGSLARISSAFDD